MTVDARVPTRGELQSLCNPPHLVHSLENVLLYVICPCGVELTWTALYYLKPSQVTTCCHRVDKVISKWNLLFCGRKKKLPV